MKDIVKERKNMPFIEFLMRKKKKTEEQKYKNSETTQ